MLFWIICAVMAVLSVATLIVPLMRPTDAGPQDHNALDIYKGQLAEVDRDLARGVLAPEDAERTRTEIARRLLAADKEAGTQNQKAPKRITTLLALISAVMLIGGAGGLYWQLGAPGYPDIPLQTRLDRSEDMRANRPAQLDMQASILADRGPTPPPEVPADYQEMVTQLRNIVPTRPEDIQGWQLLARHEAAMLQYSAAAAAQAQVVSLMGLRVTVQEQLRLVDMMVAATEGYVSPEAEFITRQILDRDPENTGARYYLGLMYDGTDRPDLAVRLWEPLIENGTPGDVHVRLARSLIEAAAFRAGLDYTLPAQAPLAGPTSDDIAAAGDMSQEDRAAMIQDMVSQLSNRLATDGGTSAEWARLIGALSVLGDTDRATLILNEARSVFADHADDLDIIETAAQRAGLTQ